MVKVSRQIVNITAHASNNMPRAALYAASHIASILKTATIHSVVSVVSLSISLTKTMRTMTSMMMTMPLRGVR